MLVPLEKLGFDVRYVSHAKAILEMDFPAVAGDLVEILRSASVPMAEVIGSGGGETQGTQRLRRELTTRSWKKARFEIRKTINGVERESQSHEIDHVRTFENGTIALEIEWNNKDPFFDRDLENYKRLHSEGAIGVGIIVTRGASLQNQISRLVLDYANQAQINDFEDVRNKLHLTPTPRQITEVARRVEREKNPIPFTEAWTDQFVSDKYGAATTHWAKLIDRIDRGVGNPCPLVLIGLPSTIVRT